jgi:hypothetical protein
VAVKFNESDEYEIEEISDAPDELVEADAGASVIPEAIADRMNPTVNIPTEDED